jgi:hypothetical protein
MTANIYDATTGSLEAVDFFQFGFDGLLTFPCYRTKAGMKVFLVQDKNEIALARRRTIEPIRAVEADVHFLGIALELVTGQAVNLQSLGLVQAFLPGKNDKPMVARKARRPALPNLPLVYVHRSGFCTTLPIADSNAALSLSGP